MAHGPLRVIPRPSSPVDYLGHSGVLGGFCWCSGDQRALQTEPGKHIKPLFYLSSPNVLTFIGGRKQSNLQFINREKEIKNRVLKISLLELER